MRDAGVRAEKVDRAEIRFRLRDEAPHLHLRRHIHDMRYASDLGGGREQRIWIDVGGDHGLRSFADESIG